MSLPLTAGEKQLAVAIGFEEQICQIVKQETGGSLERLQAINEEYELEPARGLSIAVDRKDVDALIAKLQPQLVPLGYRVFWSEALEADGRQKNDELAVLNTADPYSIVQVKRANGANYGVSMDDVLARLKDWENRCRFEIVGAAGAWVAIQFETLPENLCAFAEEIYDFCPDTVEQGVGLMDESDDPEAFEAARQLCPELSPEMQAKLNEQNTQFQQMDMPPQVRALLDSGVGGFSTPNDMGLRLLALQLKESKQLLLWWD